MPSTIYLSSGDEFVVKESYDGLLVQWAAGDRVELTAIWWSDPEGSGFDPLSTWPSYRESRLTIDLSAAVAVEEEDLPTLDAIERARAHHFQQD